MRFGRTVAQRMLPDQPGTEVEVHVSPGLDGWQDGTIKGSKVERV